MHLSRQSGKVNALLPAQSCSVILPQGQVFGEKPLVMFLCHRTAGPLLLNLCTALLAGCSSLQWHEPAPHPDGWHHEPWLLHCETAQSFLAVADGVGNEQLPRWIWATDASGNSLLIQGTLEDGFLRAGGVSAGETSAQSRFDLSRRALRDACVETLARDDDEAHVLARVRAARHGEAIDVPLVFPGERGQPLNRLVIFGDSLSDSGNLRKRLHIFPGEPYWLGRFSNGPNWVDYLEVMAGLSVQNHAYGGAVAVRHPHIPGKHLIPMIKDGGQLLVTGSLPLQVSDYIEHNLENGRLQRSDHTVFAIWSGANDYISKEPFSGEITTFLNSPGGVAGYERVVNEVIASIRLQVETLYAAGARQFLLINLPDMGATPIVLQNQTYFPPMPAASDAERKLILADRLSTLTRYHNVELARAVRELRQSLPDGRIVLLDTARDISRIVQGDDPTYGFLLDAQRQVIESDDASLALQRPCYTGGYLGGNDPAAICEEQRRVFFWDVIHPTTYAHCWQAYFIQRAMADAGWLRPVKSVETHARWCARQ